jgi:2-keto-4-pentenoate hydratase/2-oxohepta-3-ene-1,7-dioic acid hydratase in catechol pathway
MILATFCLADGVQRVGVVKKADNMLVDLAAAYTEETGKRHPAFVSMLSLIEGGAEALESAGMTADEVAVGASSRYRLDEVRLLAPIPQPPQMRDFSVFKQHMQWAGAGMAKIRRDRLQTDDPLPNPRDIELSEVFYKQPIYYKANRFSVVGHEHDVQWPSYAALLDYELEFGVYLSGKGRDIPADKAGNFIFGYTIYNDFTARDTQEYEMCGLFGPAKGKDFDTGNVMGPWIVTADEIPDPYALTMVARVNGKEWSRSSSNNMIHGFEEMIAHVSRDETLHPGEFFGSGTTGGGCGLELDRWLRPGDVVELEVEGIGTLRNRVVRR